MLNIMKFAVIGMLAFAGNAISASNEKTPLVLDSLIVHNNGNVHYFSGDIVFVQHNLPPTPSEIFIENVNSYLTGNEPVSPPGFFVKPSYIVHTPFPTEVSETELHCDEYSMTSDTLQTIELFCE